MAVRRRSTPRSLALKYDTYNVNYSALEKELGHHDEDPYVDKWADQYADEDEDDKVETA